MRVFFAANARIEFICKKIHDESTIAGWNADDADCLTRRGHAELVSASRNWWADPETSSG